VSDSRDEALRASSVLKDSSAGDHQLLVVMDIARKGAVWLRSTYFFFFFFQVQFIVLR
jgi:hypothetical protein